MDLTIKLDGENYLNIRVALIVQTKNGFVLQKHKRGFYFFLGGRLKTGESSLQAAKREMMEETGLEIENFKLVSVLENFFSGEENTKTQEICFVYTTPIIEKIDWDIELVEINKEDIVEVGRQEMIEMDILPEIIKKLILESKLEAISHFIV